jgi:hypothetical protein
VSDSQRRTTLEMAGQVMDREMIADCPNPTVDAEGVTRLDRGTQIKRPDVVQTANESRCASGSPWS